MSHWVPATVVVPAPFNVALHACELPPPTVLAHHLNGQYWLCTTCLRHWKPSAFMPFTLMHPVGGSTLIQIPVWSEVKPIPVFNSTEEADNFLEGRP